MRLAAFALMALLPGCATIMEGTSQTVTVSSDPAGASCNVDRQGQRLGQVSPTPGAIRVDKSKNDLSLTCTHEGYQAATVSRSPKFVGTTFGNILIGGLVGAVVDASTGANYEYPSEIKVPMAPVPPATAAAPSLTEPAIAPISGKSDPAAFPRS